MEKVQSLTVQHHIKTRLQKSPDVIVRYADHLKTAKKPQTVFEYVKDILLFWDYLKEQAHQQEKSWSQESLKSLTKDDVESFLFEHLSRYERTYERLDGKQVIQGFKNRTSGQRRKLSAIRSFVRYLMVEEEWLTHDITFSIEIEQQIGKKPATLNQRELDTYFQSIEVYTEDEFQRTRNRVLSQFFLYMGLKTSEVLALDINDIHIEEETVKITRKDDEVEIIQLPKQMMADMKRYLQERMLRPIPMGWHEKALFVSLRNKRLNPKTIHYFMERYKSLTDIETPVSPQILRNTYASRTLLHVGELEEVAKRLGNRDKYATKRTYEPTVAKTK